MVLSKIKRAVGGKLEKRPAEAPKTYMDMVFTLAEAMRFGYAETLGKWNLLDLPRAILYSIMEKILKPAFTVIRDKEAKCLFVFIRGTRSIKDTLTDAIGAPVSFNHFICSDGELKKNNVISGHGHRGMVAAAGWIKKHCTPKLLDELRQYPDFQIKIVGHSLGGAACMSLDLAEFGKPFVTSIINGYDMVPTLSACSVHDFISEGLIKRKKFINSAFSAIGSRIPFASGAKAIADRAVSRGTEVVMKSKQRTRSLITWPRRENAAALSSSKSEDLTEASQSSDTSYEVTEELIISEFTSDEDDGSKSSSEGSDNDDMDEEEEQIISATHNIANDELNQYLKEIQLEAQDDYPNINGAKEKEAATKEDTTEAEMIDEVVHIEESGGSTVTTSDKPVRHHLYPPGRILHIVPVLSHENSKSNHNDDGDEKHVVLYETGREVYGKLRLSRGMLFDHMTGKYLKDDDEDVSSVDDNSFIDDKPAYHGSDEPRSVDNPQEEEDKEDEEIKIFAR
ncbi:hypothetical protein VNO80_09002 [Phaseolus coccineus]|uniref:Fungal lipase-type domain-containing protein n=1 Tax=Phaseolus coccineus TaxID=3886 RepID=A0AAN9NAM1_PHACN